MRFLAFFFALFFANCSLVFYRSIAVNSENFDYSKVSEAHFGFHNEVPVPLTVRRGNNIFGRTTKDGRYLFFAGEDGGTFNILFRDLKTAVIVPVTKHPSNDTKPAIHPSGKKIAFVTERFDSEGDIAIMNVNPAEWLEKYLQGERLALNEKLIVPTNPNFSDPSKIQRFIDTDPTWSPDGRYVLFATDRFSRGKTNLAIIDTQDNYKITQITTEGGASPCFAPNGKDIFYVSYKHHPQGEIYKLNLETKEEFRITNDEFIDLSPNVSDDGKYLIYTSIRKDTNNNNNLGLRDNSFIIKIDLETKKKYVLTDGSLSIFDANYSSFNNGSIIFSASLYNSLNVYFIPLEGEIPKQKDIYSHYEFAKKYKDRSVAFHEIAFNSIGWFYENDPLYPLIHSRSLRQLAKEYKEEGNSQRANEIYKEMLAHKYHPQFGFSYALAFYELNKSKNKDLTPELWKYFEEMKQIPNVHPQIPPAILYWIGRVYFEQKQLNKTLEVYEKVLKEYPNFYEIDDLKYYMGNILYERNTSKIPQPYLELLKNNQENGEVIHKIFEDLHSDFLEITDLRKRKEYLESLLQTQKEIGTIPKLKALIEYSIAEVWAELDEFEKSNQILQSIKKEVPQGSYMFLKASLLLVNNYEKTNQILESEREMYEFVSVYSPFSGFPFEQRELEEIFINFETKAKIFVGKGEWENAIQVYIKMNDIIDKAIERKLPISSLLNRYKNYYHKKLVETAFAYADSIRKEKQASLFAKLNIVKQTDPLGNITESLALVFRGSWFRIFGDFRDIQFLSPMEKEGIETIEEYYLKNINHAKSVLDLGFVYGYAYFLIRKASLEEEFYIQEKALTEARKKAILRQLRTAELELLWCIYAKPDFIDAYLLLGWLYQYIDIRKENDVFPEYEKDRVVFRPLYLKTFPRKYLEENIDVYTHALEISKNSIEAKSELAIHLNLGNNYFLLNNYQKALTHYEEVEKLSEKVLEHTLFETYNQKALFHFNYARALIYNGKVRESIPHLTRVKEIYYQEEYFPLVSKISSEERKLYETKFEEAKKKLALIHALLGLVYLEIEKFNSAILSLETAIFFNSNSEYINKISLFNTIAICYQKIGEYPQSEKYLDLAHKEYANKISLLDAFDFSIWNIVLSDADRVIGKGRFVGEFPLEFSNLLTQSIQIQNRLQLKEFDNTKELIENRKKFIHKKSLEKYVMGQKLLDLTLDDLGYTEFARGNFIKAEEYYEKNYKLLEKAGKDKEAFASFHRGSIALFSSIEQNSIPIQKLKEILYEDLNFLIKTYENEIKQCTSKKGKLDYETYITCKKEFYNTHIDYDPLLAYTYFYLGEAYFTSQEYESAFEYYGKALNLFETPMEIPISEIGLTSDPFTKKERTRFALAQAVIHFRLGDKEKYAKKIQEAYNLAVEFEFQKELVFINLINAEVEYIYAKNQKNFRTVIERINRIESKLKNSIGLFYEIDENTINYMYSLKNYCYVHLQDLNELRKTRESLYSAIFFRQLLTNEFRFQDVELFRRLNKIQFLVSEDREYALNIEASLEREQNPSEIVKRKERNHKKILEEISEIKKRFPKGSDAFSWLETRNLAKPNLVSEEVIVELFSAPNEVLVTFVNNKKQEVYKLQVSKQNLENALVQLLEKELPKHSRVKRVVLIPSNSLYNILFHNLAYQNKTLNDFFEIRFLFRFSQLEREIETGFSRLRRVTTVDTREERKKALLANILINPLELLIPPAFIEEEKLKELNSRIVRSENLIPYLTDTDILEGPTDFTNRKQLIGENKKGYINLKQIVENQWNIPLLVLNNYTNSMENFIKIGFLYDILQFAGIQSIVLIEGNANAEKIRDALIHNIQNSNQTIRKEKLLLVGEPVNPYPNLEKIYKEEFEKFTKIGISYERLGYQNKNYNLNAMRAYLQANSVLSQNKSDLQVLSEINIARVKTKLFPNEEDPLQYFKELLTKFKEGEPFEAKVLFHTLFVCYSANINTTCEDFYRRFLKNQHVTSENKKLIELFRNLKFGNLNEISERDLQINNLEIDEFLVNLELSLLFKKNLEFKESLAFLDKNQKLVQNQKEKDSLKYLQTEIEFEQFFVKGIDSGNLLDPQNLYSLGKSKEWKDYKAKLEMQLENERNHFKKDYLERIYSSYEKIIGSSFFEVSSLSPVFFKDRETSLQLLNTQDRSFLFYLLLVASFYHPKTEISSQVNLILETEEKLQNKNRYLWMLLKWAEILYFHSHFESSKKYFALFEKNISKMHKHLEDEYLLLKYELSLIYPEIKISSLEKEKVKKFFSTLYENYEEVLKTIDVNNIPLIIQKIIANYKKQKIKIDFFEEKNFSNFLNFCMHRAKENKSSSVLFELGVYKEKWKAYNERIFGKDLFSNEIPDFPFNLVKQLQTKIPQNQQIISLLDLGNQTYSVFISSNEIVLKNAWNNNEALKKKVLDYNLKIQRGGSYYSEAKGIEYLYRSIINIPEKQIVYFYFPSYHFKAPIEFNEVENVYYITNLEVLLDRKPMPSKEEVFEYNIRNYKTANSPEWWRDLKNLEDFEIKNKSKPNNTNTFHLSQEILEFYENKRLTFNNQNLNQLNLATRTGKFGITGNLLLNSSLKNDDMFHSLYFLANVYNGFGFVEILNAKDTHTAYFVKKFFEKKSGNMNFYERFFEASSQAKKDLKEDRFFVGWKPITNVFVLK